MFKERVNEQHLEFPRFHRRLKLIDDTPTGRIDFSGGKVDDQRVAVVGAGQVVTRGIGFSTELPDRFSVMASIRKYHETFLKAAMS